MKKLLIFFLLLSLFIMPVAAADRPTSVPKDEDSADVPAAVFAEAPVVTTADELKISAPSAILIEKESGTVLYEKNADEKLEPASVTKIMTILLIVEAIDAGTLTLDDIVTTSAHAASMGGSQVYLEEGEKMSVRDMLKAIVVSSANDAAVAMAEQISGTEPTFVSKMNERAAQLGMVNTHFTNCSGLIDDVSHVTTARDVAIMSRELIKHDMIKQFTKIWMDKIRNGEFGLSNTNKLIYYYDGATGLKTGFTQGAMYCLSATAERNGIEYIAVVMHVDTSPNRFESAKTLLSYGFANYTLVNAAPDEVLLPMAVKLGKDPYVQPVLQKDTKILIKKTEASSITKKVEMMDSLTAPVAAGQQVGTLTVYKGSTELGTYPIVAGDAVERLTWGDVFVKFLKLMFTGGL